jgi:putative tryptophan/tyrosine transport system substrate-binding protein
LLPKRLELLHEVVPKATAIGFLVNPTSSFAESDARQAETAARALGHQLQLVKASTEPDIEIAFGTLLASRTGALLVEPDTFFNSQRRVEQVATLAVRHGLPAMHSVREFVVAGGLMSYAPSLVEVYRQVGVYAARVLKGDKPADLPVQQPTKIEFVVNLKAARALGVTVPLSLLAIADEVIE